MCLPGESGSCPTSDAVRSAAHRELENVTLVALAGEQYRTVLFGSPWPSEVRMKGLSIGQQLGWLTNQLAPKNM